MIIFDRFNTFWYKPNNFLLRKRRTMISYPIEFKEGTYIQNVICSSLISEKSGMKYRRSSTSNQRYMFSYSGEHRYCISRMRCHDD